MPTLFCQLKKEIYEVNKLKMKKFYGPFAMLGAAILLAIVGMVASTIRDNMSGLETPMFTERRLIETEEHGLLSVRYIEFMNDELPNRFGFSYEELRTANWLVEELAAIGFSQDLITVQAFSRADAIAAMLHYGPELVFGLALTQIGTNSPFYEAGLRADEMSQNIILTIPGISDEVIVVGAHYDSVMFPSASDNASGVALLLESASRMLEVDNYYTIQYVFFGAEEVGLAGVYYYIASLSHAEHENIVAMINADILLEGDGLFLGAGYYAGGEIGANPVTSVFNLLSINPAQNQITQTWDDLAVMLSDSHDDLDFISDPYVTLATSDHIAFLHYGHTVVVFVGMDMIDGWYDLGRGITSPTSGMIPLLHSSRDDFHYINENFPGRMERNMRGFSLLLEEMLLVNYE